MAININITINAPELEKEMQILSAALSAFILTSAEGQAPKATKTEPKSIPEKTAPQLEKEDTPQESDKADNLTIEEVRAAFMAKNSKNNKPKLKAILDNFGVKKVTDLKEEDFPAVLKALEAI